MAQARVEQLHTLGEKRAYLYGADDKFLGGLNSFYLLVDQPEVYGSAHVAQDAHPEPDSRRRSSPPPARWCLRCSDWSACGSGGWTKAGRREAGRGEGGADV